MLLAWPAASAKDLGTDVMGNISPRSQLARDSLVDRYPLSAFSLDYNTDVGITELDGVPPTIAHWAAAQIWSLTTFLLKTVINLFTWAFSLDLLGVNPDRPDEGALAPVAKAITNIYENVLGQSWMAAAIVLAGIWGIWKALVQRRYTETVGGLAVSLLFVLVALFFVYQPQSTVGAASRWTNDMSLAFLSGANRGTLDDPAQAKRDIADQLFDGLIYKPWTVLEFGGLRHCVDTGRRDGDGYPRPVDPQDPTRDVCRDHLKQGQDGHGGYAERFLRFPAGSSERDAEYDALRKGSKPTDDPHGQFRGYEVDKSDSPAVDVQQEHGAYQRLTLAAILFVGSLGAVALLGFLSLAVILAQVVALVVLGFAPVALVIGILPGAGHDFFRNWLGKLGAAIFVKALYSLVIAIVVAVSAALTSSTASLGFLFAFGLQAIFFWAIFLYRKQITARLVAATTGSHYDERLPRMNVVQRAGNVAARPFSALVGFGMGRRSADKQQESGLVAADNDDRHRHEHQSRDREDVGRRRRHQSSASSRNESVLRHRSDIDHEPAGRASGDSDSMPAGPVTEPARFSAGTPVRVRPREASRGTSACRCGRRPRQALAAWSAATGGRRTPFGRRRPGGRVPASRFAARG